jgi:hypothetical protein
VFRQLLSENTPQQVPKEGDAGLNVNVELPFRNIQDVMLGRVSQTVDGLKNQRLFVSKEFNSPVAQPPPNARVEAYRFLRARLTDSPPTIQDCRLQKHLEAVIEQNQDRAYPTALLRAIEKFDAQEQ